MKIPKIVSRIEFIFPGNLMLIINKYYLCPSPEAWCLTTHLEFGGEFTHHTGLGMMPIKSLSTFIKKR